MAGYSTSPHRAAFLKAAAEIEVADPVPIDLLMKASAMLAAWQQAGGEHVAPVPEKDPEEVARAIAAAEQQLAELKGT